MKPSIPRVAAHLVRALLPFAAFAFAPVHAGAQTATAPSYFRLATTLGSPGAVRAGEQAFVRAQLGFPRVRAARDNRAARVHALFTGQGIDPTRAQVYLRAFKRERILELWARPDGAGPFRKLGEYPICAVSGGLGPKRRQGDEQVPEGFYAIEEFNPWSSYHLSLGLNYPNRADRLRARAGTRLGGDIFIHGDCRTVGCLPMTDELIEELYWVAVQARAAGQKEIPVHIFPGRMDARGMAALERLAAGNPSLLSFWRELKPGYDHFEATREVPEMGIGEDGRYTAPAVAAFPFGTYQLSLGAVAL